MGSPVLSVLIALSVMGASVAGCTTDERRSGTAGSRRAPAPKVVAAASDACLIHARALRPSTAAQAIRAAERAAIRADPVIETQGRRVPRTAASLGVLAIMRAGTMLVPEARRLHREAVRRCGRETVATRAAWAVVFHEEMSVLCCETWTIFVVRTERGWRSF